MHRGNGLETSNHNKGFMNHANTSFSKDICAGAIISVVQYIAPLGYTRTGSGVRALQYCVSFCCGLWIPMRQGLTNSVMCRVVDNKYCIPYCIARNDDISYYFLSKVTIDSKHCVPCSSSLKNMFLPISIEAPNHMNLR
jgi:hypothetical protein